VVRLLVSIIVSVRIRREPREEKRGWIFAGIDQGDPVSCGPRASKKLPEGSLLSNSLCSRLSFLGIGSEVIVGAETQFEDEAAG